MMCDSKWVFSNSILFGENNPSWSALFSRDAGNNSPPQREELGFFLFLSHHGRYPRSHLTTAGPPVPSTTWVTTSKC